MTVEEEDAAREVVKKRYGEYAQGKTLFSTGQAELFAKAMGYTAEQLQSLPGDANMGLSCGNTIPIANIRPGETVVDLGSGAGLDVFLASKKVGEKGKVIGVDMTPEMIARARRNAEKGGYKNVEFVENAIEDMRDIPSGVADCVISNCVLNLCPNKPKAFAEIFRIIKPGGRLVVSDIGLKKPLPPFPRTAEIEAYLGCFGGALLAAKYYQMLGDAGFAAVQLIDKKNDLNVWKPRPGQLIIPDPENSLGKTVPATTPSSGCSDACWKVQLANSIGGFFKAFNPLEYLAKREAQPAGCCSPGGLNASPQTGLKVGTPGTVDLYDLVVKYGFTDFNEYAASYNVFAVKSL